MLRRYLPLALLCAAAIGAAAVALARSPDPEAPRAGGGIVASDPVKGSGPAGGGRERKGGAGAAGEQADAGAAETPSERAVRATAERFYAILNAEGKFDSAAFCELMSPAARRETVAYARRSSGIARDWDCAAAVSLLVARAKQNGSFGQARKAEVVAANVDADRATATVRARDGSVTSLPLVRDGGEWRLAAAPTQEGS